MTRINVGILPAELTDKHLIAEHREIKRIPNCVAKGKYSMTGKPKEFKLGAGHVKFFYDKLSYLLKRYKELYAECLKRGFNVQNYVGAWDNVPKELLNDYSPTEQDRIIVQQRISEKQMQLSINQRINNDEEIKN
jgi:deoxyribonuclease (pyrimidine dimer)